jgi:hypothetical protein
LPMAGLILLIMGAGSTVNGSVPEMASVATFSAATVNAPAVSRVVVPASDVAVFVVSAALATVHGAQPGPLMTTFTLAGSNFVPVMMKVNCCAARGKAGVVTSLVKLGTGATVSGSVPEVALVATFWTVTVNAPALAMVAGPIREAAVFVVSAVFGMVQGAHPGPLMMSSALAGSKFVPAMVSVKFSPAKATVGVV